CAVLSALPESPCSPSSAALFSLPSAHHRALHSFPTRRSSDLAVMASYPLRVSISATFSRICASSSITRIFFILFTYAANIEKKRSEEHTSELQSRENLVCRLLLEKKKKN